MRLAIKRLKLWGLASILLATAGLVAPVSAAETNLRMHTGSPGGSPYVLAVTLQSVLQKNLPVRINLTSSMAATRSTLDAARGEVDLFIGSPSVNHFMSTGTAMYANLDNAPELYKNVRQIMNFPLGPYHIMVHANSGITSLKQIKGKRVFVGPPGGAATLVGLSIIEAATGYQAGRDYEMARLDWNSGHQAFQDGQVDLYIGPSQLPAPSIEQLVMLQKVLFLGIPDEALETDVMKKVLAMPGRTIMQIPPGIYGANQMNTEPVNTVGSWAGLGTRKGMDEELVYQVTKTIFENLETFYKAAKFLETVNLENAVKELNCPLHPGALRYYRERGVELPASAIPPEADE